MITPIILPKQGNTVETCLILEWKKKKGENVRKGEVVCEIETDKAVFDIESPADGTLLEIFFRDGDEVPVLTNIAVVGAGGESFAEFDPRGGASGAGRPKEASQTDGAAQPVPVEASPGKATNAVPADGENESLRTRISPRARNLANTEVPTKGIRGTGPGGRIIERDIVEAKKKIAPLSRAAGEAAAATGSRPGAGSGIGERVTLADIADSAKESESPEERTITVVALKGIRKLIAERMLESLRNSAQLTLNSSADASALLALRGRFKSSVTHKEFQSVTINDLVQYAVVRVLPQHPELNALLNGDLIEYHDKIHLGFAVDTPRGLMVPVIRNAGALNLLALSLEAKRLSSACLSGKISPDELNGGTFTTTNLGSLGVESFTPVLNLPQTGILGINTITPRAVEKGNGLEFIPHISFSLTIDHRVIDGAAGARFLQSLAKTITEIDLAVTTDAMRK